MGPVIHFTGKKSQREDAEAKQDHIPSSDVFFVISILFDMDKSYTISPCPPLSSRVLSPTSDLL